MPAFATRAFSAAIAVICATAPLAASADLYRDAGPAVISLRVSGLLREPEEGEPSYNSRGTGFVISPEGHVLTAAHLVRDARFFVDGTVLIEGRFPQLVDNALVASGPPFRLQVINVGRGSEDDVALLQIVDVPRHLPYLRSCDGAAPDEVVRTLGYAFTGTAFGGDGLLSIVRGEVATPSLRGSPMRLNARGAPGLSGGPVVGASDHVVGIFLGEERTLALEPHEDYAIASRALPSRRAFEVVAPNDDGLRGRSFSEDCLSFTALSGGFFSKSEVRRVYVATPFNRRHEITTEFEAPPGTQFLVEQAREEVAPSVGLVVNNVAYAWNHDRTRFVVRSNVSSTGMLQLYQELQTSVSIPLIPRTPEVRGFPIVRSETPQRETDFTDQIDAPAGYKFARALGFEVLTADHASAPILQMSEDGTAIRVSYRLGEGRHPVPSRLELMVHAMVTPLTH